VVKYKFTKGKIMKFENVKSSFNITQRVLDKIGKEFESLHVHDPSSEIEGLFDEVEIINFNFFQEDEIDCRDVLWVNQKKEDDVVQYITIGKEPSKNCWSMDWGITDAPRSEFSVMGDEERVYLHVLWIMGHGKMPS
jgi:hypothetical protein